MTDYRDSCVNETKASAYWIGAGIVAIIALLGVMGERDREHKEEVNALLKIIGHQSMKIRNAADTDCAPAMEMDMPVDMGRVQS